MEKKIDYKFIISIILISIYCVLEAVICFIGYDIKQVFGPIVIAVLVPMAMAQLIYIRRIEGLGSILVSLYSIGVSIALVAITPELRNLIKIEALVYVIGVLLSIIYIIGIWLLHFWALKNKEVFKKQKFSLDPKDQDNK